MQASRTQSIYPRHIIAIQQTSGDAINLRRRRTSERFAKNDLAAETCITTLGLMPDGFLHPVFGSTLPPLFISIGWDANIIEVIPDDIRVKLTESAETSCFARAACSCYEVQHKFLPQSSFDLEKSVSVFPRQFAKHIGLGASLEHG